MWCDVWPPLVHTAGQPPHVMWCVTSSSAHAGQPPHVMWCVTSSAHAGQPPHVMWCVTSSAHAGQPSHVMWCVTCDLVHTQVSRPTWCDVWPLVHTAVRLPVLRAAKIKTQTGVVTAFARLITAVIFGDITSAFLPLTSEYSFSLVSVGVRLRG